MHCRVRRHGILDAAQCFASRSAAWATEREVQMSWFRIPVGPQLRQGAQQGHRAAELNPCGIRRSEDAAPCCWCGGTSDAGRGRHQPDIAHRWLQLQPHGLHWRTPLNLAPTTSRTKRPNIYTWPGSNWRPSACEADVIATRPQVPLTLREY